jgi:hypothetical protein
MTRIVFRRSKGTAIGVALALAALATPAAGAAPGCKNGRQSAFLTNNPVLPCTFGVGDPTNPTDPLHASDPLEVPSIPAFGVPFNGEHTSILFLNADPLGPGVQNSSGLDCGSNHDTACMPQSASAGTPTASVTPTVSTADGAAEITNVRVTMIDPAVFGTGTLSWSASVNPDGLGTMTSPTLDQNTTFYDFPLAQPATSVAAGYAFTLGCGGACAAGVNDASVFGVKVNLTLPEPDAAAGAVAALGLLAELARRRGTLLR